MELLIWAPSASKHSCIFLSMACITARWVATLMSWIFADILFFRSCSEVGLLRYTLFSKYLQRKKFRGVRSGEREGQFTSPNPEINLLGNSRLRTFIDCLAVCAVVPFCCIQWFWRLFLLISGRKKTFKHFAVALRIDSHCFAFTVFK